MLDLLCSDSIKEWSEFLTAEKLLKKEAFYENDQCFSFIEDDKVIIKGVAKKIKRVYVRDKDRTDDGVGWVLNEDIDRCMICDEEFNFYCWPHHCRACGNIVCSKCSPDEAEIIEFPEFKMQRVCMQCGFGQSKVHALKIRLR